MPLGMMMSDASTEPVETEIAEPAGEDLRGAIASLAKRATDIGLDVANVNGALLDASSKADGHGALFSSITGSARDIVRRNEQIAASAARNGEIAISARENLDAASAKIEESLTQISSVDAAAERITGEVEEFATAMKNIARFAHSIAGVAKQTSLLAINASIEAARAGDVGRGFAVVANEVRALSQKTTDAAMTIQSTLKDIDAKLESLTKAGEDTGAAAQSARGISSDLRATFADMALAFREMVDRTESTVQETRATNELCAAFLPELESAVGDVADVETSLRAAADGLDKAVGKTERMIQAAAASGVDLPDARWIEVAQASAGVIGKLFAGAIEKGRLTESQLFDENYEPIPGTDPEQMSTSFVEFTDNVLPAVQEAVLSSSDDIVFCAAVDRNGYLPTHNLKFSQPQRPDDPAWNAANARNRRIFDDRTGLAAGRSEEPFLLQTYRRDMGGGSFIMMKDISAPIRVNGRHWGGLRVAVKA